jgi:hypothetical protein
MSLRRIVPGMGVVVLAAVLVAAAPQAQARGVKESDQINRALGIGFMSFKENGKGEIELGNTDSKSEGQKQVLRSSPRDKDYVRGAVIDYGTDKSRKKPDAVTYTDLDVRDGKVEGKVGRLARNGGEKLQVLTECSLGESVLGGGCVSVSAQICSKLKDKNGIRHSRILDDLKKCKGRAGSFEKEIAKDLEELTRGEAASAQSDVSQVASFGAPSAVGIGSSSTAASSRGSRAYA